MGSILSFPVLCLANFIAYWRAHDITKYEIGGNEVVDINVNLDQGISTDEVDTHNVNRALRCLERLGTPDYEHHFCEVSSGVLVNGDDILFKADAPFYELWKSEVDNFGF
jgi:hypothetical protein